MKNLRLAMIQMNSIIGQPMQNLETMCASTAESSRNGADIVCFPECSLTGYSTDRPEEFALDVSDGIISEATSLSKRYGCVLCFGYIVNATGGFRIAQTIVDGDASVTYFKTHLGDLERKNFIPGDEFIVLNTKKAAIGLELCLECHIPDISTVLRHKGAELILIPHSSHPGGVNRKNSWMKILPARAVDNRIFVAACNSVGSNGRGSEFGGGAIIIDPYGEVVAESFCNDEPIMYCDISSIDLNSMRAREMPESMRQIDFFKKRRPELYR